MFLEVICVESPSILSERWWTVEPVWVQLQVHKLCQLRRLFLFLMWPAFPPSIQRKIWTPLQLTGSCGNACLICIWWQRVLRKMNRKLHFCCILEGWIFRSFITRYWLVQISSRSLRVWCCWITISHHSWMFHLKDISLGKWNKCQESRWISSFFSWSRKQSPVSLKMLMRQQGISLLRDAGITDFAVSSLRKQMLLWGVYKIWLLCRKQWTCRSRLWISHLVRWMLSPANLTAKE